MFVYTSQSETLKKRENKNMNVSPDKKRTKIAKENRSKMCFQ